VAIGLAAVHFAITLILRYGFDLWPRPSQTRPFRFLPEARVRSLPATRSASGRELDFRRPSLTLPGTGPIRECARMCTRSWRSPAAFAPIAARFDPPSLLPFDHGFT
jgi:hypothetical protein